MPACARAQDGGGSTCIHPAATNQTSGLITNSLPAQLLAAGHMWTAVGPCHAPNTDTHTHTLPAPCLKATKKVSVSAATAAFTAEPGLLSLAGGVGALSCAAHGSCCRLACLCCWGRSGCRVSGGSSRCCGLALPAPVVCHGSSSRHAQCGDGTSDQQASLGCCWCSGSSGGAVCAGLQALGALDRGLHSCGAGRWGLSDCRCHRGGHHHGCLLLLWGWGLDLCGQQHT